MNKVMFVASVLAMTFSACANADGKRWENYNARLIENSEIRDLSFDACNKLQLELELRSGRTSTRNKFNSMELIYLNAELSDIQFIFKTEDKYLNIHCFGEYSWVETLTEEDYTKLKEASDQYEQQKENSIDAELEGLL